MLTSDGLSAGTIVQAHVSGSTTCEATISQVFKALPDAQTKLNCFTEWFEDEAMAQARRADEHLAAGHALGLLHGVPMTIKDMTPTKGHHTTRGSFTTGEGKTNYDAIVVERLKKAGAIVIGKTTTAELAYSSFTRTPRYGVTRNPWDPSKTSGGSSGGAAVSVAIGLVPLAEGTDMGGSVRIPAAACGVVGFKPSLGRIPMDILPGALETISHFGAIARCVGDAALFVAATSGVDPADMFSDRPRFEMGKTAQADPHELRVALCIDLGYFAVDPEVEAALRQTAKTFARAGADINEIELPWSRAVFDQWAVRWNCLLAMYPDTQTDAQKGQMDPFLVSFIEEGRRTSAMSLLEVDVLRKQMNADLASVFGVHDVLICPTLAIPAPSADLTDADFEKTGSHGKLQAFDMAHPFNMVPSCPALSLPIGLTKAGLPMAVQIVGRPFQDEATLAVGRALEALIPPLPLPSI